METSTVLQSLAALAQPSRLAIFRLLIQLGPDGLAASRIAERLEIAPSALSFHMKELVHSGLVNGRQEGRYVIYSANVDAINALVLFLTENCCGGQSCGVVQACCPADAASS